MRVCVCGGGWWWVYDSSSPYASIVGIFEKTDSGLHASRVHAVPRKMRGRREAGAEERARRWSGGRRA